MTKQLFYFLTFLVCIFSSCRKDKTPPPFLIITPQPIVEIPEGLSEISGIIPQGEKNIIAHNDGGHGPYLFDISLKEKMVNRKIKIQNATNFDWEDITQDQQYIYVAESGNNNGDRTDLKILKISKSNFQNQDSVTAEIIEFHYPDQTNFTASDDHNFDCEGVLSFGDQLFLFSKNRKDAKTKWYTLPKTAGNHEATLQKEFDVEGLITGADINEDKNVIALLGYTISIGSFKPFVWLFYDFEDGNIFEGKSRRLNFFFNGQMESICFGKGNNLYFAAESESGNQVQSIFHTDIEEYLN